MILTSVILEYLNILYIERETRLYAKKGFFYKSHSDIPYNCIQSVYIKKNMFPMLFGARQYYIYTPGSFLSHGSYSIYLSKKKTNGLSSTIFGDEKPMFTYHGGFFKTILMAATRSNTLTGLLIIAPVLYKTSSVTNQLLKLYFQNTMDIIRYIISIAVPEAISGFATLLIAGWVIAFTVQLERYSFFTLEIGETAIRIKRGIFNRVEFITATKKINAIQIRQSIIMLLLNLKSTYIKTVGSGVQKGDMGLLIPADKDAHTNEILKRITSLQKQEDYKVRPVKTEFFSFLWFPIYSIGGDILTMVVLYRLGYFGEIVRVPLIVLLVVFVYWLFFRIYSYTQSEITICDKAVRIDFFDKLNITRTYIPYDRIQYVEVYQSPFQRLYKVANVKVYVYSNKTSSYRIKNLKYDKVMHAVELIENRMA